MVIEQDFLYWSLIKDLVVEQKYTILALSKDGREVLLEPYRNKQFSIVRLRRVDVDWGNRLAVDIEQAGENFAQLLKSGIRGPIRVMNVYISSLPPVDEYPEAFINGFSGTKRKIDITSTLIVKDELEAGLKKLEDTLNVPLNHLKEERKLNVEIEDIQLIRDQVITFQKQEKDEEKSILQNGKPFLSYLFLGIQIIMFFLLELNGGSTDTQNLLHFGAKSNIHIYEGEWWRFITPIFLHIGFFHLLMNSFALYYIGPAVERAYGSMRFLFIYLLAGISGSIVSFAFSPFLSAGASGAIFGCFGALLYIGIQNRKVFFRTMGSNLLIIIGINLAMGFVIPNIDNAGHIGGLIGGFLAALIVQFPKKQKKLLSLIGVVGAIILLGGLYQYGLTETEEQYSQYTAIQGNKLIQAEKYDEAYAYLNKALSKDKSSNDVLFLLSIAEFELEKYDQAKSHLHQITSNDDTYHQAHYNLAVIYINGGETTTALAEVNKALEYDPTNEDYKNLKNKMH